MMRACAHASARMYDDARLLCHMHQLDFWTCLLQRLNEEINVSDVIGQDAYRRAVALSRRRATSSRGMSVDGHAAAANGNAKGSDAASMDGQEASAAKTPPWEP